MQINTNISALNAYRNLTGTENRLNKSLERLSSGLRINRAADDAAGLSISEKMRGQISGLNQAVRNAQDGISLIQTAEGALDESHAILQRMRELSVQAANDTLTAEDRQEIQAEIDQLTQELDRIAETTEFNTKKLLDGTASAIVSTSDSNTEVFMRDGLQTVNRFGHREDDSGNYELNISVATDGESQIQKSNVFRIRDDDNESVIGNIASGGTQLKNIEQFYDGSGNFMLDEPQTITLVQGDGLQATVTLYGTDTLSGVAGKFNAVIHGEDELNQGRISSEENSYVRLSNEVTSETNYEVSGTLVMNSALMGGAGELTVVASEAVTNAFGFTEIQESEETQYTVAVTDAHDGTAIDTVTVSGNELIGVVHENVDIRFDVAAGYASGAATLSNGQWTYSQDATEVNVHLADNSMMFHIGANPLQDVSAAIGRMDAAALGVDNVQVTNRAAANESISKLDTAIGRVSAQRGKLGATQNRLEHTINNLNVASENLQAAESRIRDLDMAQEMIEFTRNQIMMQSGMGMMAQANMKPQSVLMLLG